MINSADNYSNITFEEFEFLIDFIERTDLSALTMQFLNTSMLLNLQKSLKTDTKELEKGIMLVAQRLHKMEQKGKIDT